MGVALYRWMVYKGKSRTNMDDLGVLPFVENPPYIKEQHVGLIWLY